MALNSLREPESIFFSVKRRRVNGCKWINLFIFLLFISACDSAKSRAIPAELLGTWQTEDPKYAGLFFKIEADKFSFKTASGEVKQYSISQYDQPDYVKSRSSKTHVLYGDWDGEKLTVNIAYEASGGGRLMLHNQGRTLWTRKQGGSQ